MTNTTIGHTGDQTTEGAILEGTLQAQLLSLLSDASLDPKIREGVERMNAIHAKTDGSNFAAVVRMLEEQGRGIEETREKATAGAANSKLIAEGMQRQDQVLARQEDAVHELRSFLQAELSSVAATLDTFGERLTTTEAEIVALKERSNQVHDRINGNSERIETIENFIKNEVVQLRTDLKGLGQRLDESASDRREIHREMSEMREEIA